MPTPPPLRILLAGCSIAGPTTAYFLSRFLATPAPSITVLERAPSFRTGGQNIDIRTTAVTIMRKIPGMEAAVRAKTMQLEGMQMFDAQGGSWGTLRAAKDPERRGQGLVSEYEIYRGDLSRILLDMAVSEGKKNVRCVFGEQISSIRQQGGEKGEEDDGPVTVEFLNGKLPTTEYDLVVACDGATSRTRAIGFDCGVRDHIKPTNCWAAYFSIKRDMIGGSKVAHGYSAPGGRFISIEPEPGGANRVALMAVHPKGDKDVTVTFRQAMKKGINELKQFVTGHFRGMGWRTDEAMEEMMDAEDFYASEVVQVKMPSLSKGRIVLVGDAGYAPGFTGTGTTLAMTGAYVLAGEIAKHPGDLAAGLRGYEDMMRPLIVDMQKVPPLVPTIMAPQTKWGIWLRNMAFALFAWSRVLEIGQRFLGSAFASADKYDLPEYGRKE